MDVEAIDILLVEDSPIDVKITQKALKRGRVQNNLHVVYDGEAALDYLYRRNEFADPETSPRPDLILLDLHLPKLDGRGVLEVIKSDDNLKKIPVVMLTTSAREEDIVKSYQLGVNSYITKPVEFDDFLKIILSITEYWLVIAKLPSVE